MPMDERALRGRLEAGTSPLAVAGNVRLEREPASPEEQRSYEGFVKAVYTAVLGDEQASQGLVKTLLDDQGDPVVDLGIAAAGAVDAIAQRFRKRKRQVPLEIRLAALEEVVPAFADFAERVAGREIWDEDRLSAAYLHAVSVLGDLAVRHGEISREEAQRELERLAEMDRRGELPKKLPELVVGAEFYRRMGIRVPPARGGG